MCACRFCLGRGAREQFKFSWSTLMFMIVYKMNNTFQTGSYFFLQTVYNYEKVVNCSVGAIQQMGVELNTSLPGTDLYKWVCIENNPFKEC